MTELPKSIPDHTRLLQSWADWFDTNEPYHYTDPDGYSVADNATISGLVSRSLLSLYADINVNTDTLRSMIAMFAESVAREYPDAADWKDARSRLQSMANEVRYALDLGAALTPPVPANDRPALLAQLHELRGILRDWQRMWSPHVQPGTEGEMLLSRTQEALTTGERR